ncbi:MAG: hypothetical protein ACRDS0_23435 [Pseudonocardiaceae bacterium]
MSEPSSDRPAGASSAAPAPRRRRQRAGYGYLIGGCGHRVPLVEFTPSGYYAGPCPEGCDDPQ